MKVVMNSLKIISFLAILLAIAVAVALPSADAKHHHKTRGIKHHKEPSHYLDKHHYDHHHGRPVAPWDNPRARLTCDRFPRVCHVKGSPGHDCCKKKCVDVKTDRLNCGMCGHKCRYPEICCNGRCINPFFDRHHCGGCDNKCSRGNFCYNGMCNYA